MKKVILVLMVFLIIPNVLSFERIKVDGTVFTFDNNISQQDKIDFIVKNNFHEGISQIWFLNKWNKYRALFFKQTREIVVYNMQTNEFWRESIRHEYAHYDWFYNRDYYFRQNYCDTHREEINEFNRGYYGIYPDIYGCREVYAYKW